MPLLPTTRDELIYLSKICEQTERFEDMLVYMKEVVQKFNEELSVEERNLLSVAYKNSVGSRRTAWRVVSSVESKEDVKAGTHASLLKSYRSAIEQELATICNEIIDMLDTKLVPRAKEAKGDATEVAQAQVFYLKMKGDYYRYISEFSGDKNKQAAEKALEAYTAAKEIASKNLQSTDPIRLGLALNFSVFYYEVNNSPQQACDLAKAAFDEAIANIECMPEESYKDSTTIMQLIRDNLTLWTSELEDHGDDDK